MMPGACWIGVAAMAILALEPAWADAAPKAYLCRQLTAAPELDGDVTEDAAWRDVAPATGYRVLGEARPSRKQTTFRAGFTADALYVVVVCDEPDPDSIVADMGDGEDLWDEDSVEVFLSTTGEDELQFVVNAIGSRASSKTVAEWEAATFIDDGAWTVEIALPWEVLGAFPAEGAVWGLNVTRNIVVDGTIEHHTWASVELGFHEPKRFGALRFEAVNAKIRKAIEARVAAEPVLDDRFLVVHHDRGVLLQTGSTESQLLLRQGVPVAPRFAPDGRRVLFNSVEGGASGVWVINAGGGTASRVCDGIQGTWTRDGAGVLCVRDGRIVRHDLETGTEAFASPADARPLAHPDALPEGGVVCTDAAGERLLLISRDGSGLRELDAAESIGTPRVSPDGTRVAYPRGPHISVVDVETGVRTQVVVAPGVQTGPVWGTDGASLCFSQAPAPFETNWDVWHVALADPSTVHRIRRGVLPVFDWIGVRPAPTQTSHVLGTQVNLWRRKALSRFLGRGGRVPPKGWKTVVGEVPAATRKGGLAVTNDWFAAVPSGRGVRLEATHPEVDLPPIALDFIASEHGAGPRVGATAWAEGARLAIESGGATFRVAVDRTLPLVRVAGSGREGVLTIRAGASWALSMDRLASDVLLPADRLPEDGSTCLPSSPVIVLGLTDGRGLIVVMPGNPGADVRASRGAETGLDLAVGSASSGEIRIAVLAGEGFWQWLEPVRNAGSAAWRAPWDKPYCAEWRTAVCGGGRFSARMWNEEALGGQEDGVELAWAFEAAPEWALVYAWGRDLNTPFEFVMPEDIALGASGLRGYIEAMDVAGVRGYRAASVPVSFPQVATRGLDWAPYGSHQEREGFGVLEVMRGLFGAATDGTRSFLKHFGGEAIALIEGLDTRTGEYEQFMADIRPDLGRGGFTDLDARAVETLATAEAKPHTDVAEAAQRLGALLAFLDDKRGDLSDAEAEEYRNRFRAFSRSCRRLVEERRALSEMYRGFARELCDAAAVRIMESPESREACERLRAASHSILRNRYHMEGDWHGETPLPDGTVRLPGEE